MKCKGQNKNGDNCKKWAMNNSEYCYIHSFMKFKGIPFYKNSTFHFLFATLLTIVIFLYSNWTGATKENQEKIISVQEDNYKLLEEIKRNLVKSNLIEFPGRCFCLMSRFYKDETAPKRYIFDIADQTQITDSRFRAYIFDESKICLDLVESSGNLNQLVVEKGIGNFFLNERNIWFFEYGYSDSLSYLRITKDGMVIGEKLFRKKFVLDDLNKNHIMTIGGSYNGRYLNKCDLWFSFLTKQSITFTLKNKRSMVNIIQVSPLFDDPIPPKWAQLKGKNYLMTDLSSENKDLKPISLE